MKFQYMFLLAAGLIAVSAHATVSPVCDRTAGVKQAIQEALANKPCDQITEADLLTLKRVAPQGKNITAFKPDDFSGLTNLEILNIRSNPYTELPEGLFKDLVHLKTIVIIETKLRHFPDDFLAYAPEIENVYTFEMDVRSISESVLTRLEAAPIKAMDFDDALQDAEKARIKNHFANKVDLNFH
jgi:hypothetical protein